MKRIPFEQVEIQLLKIYNFKETNESKIDDQCELANAFIESCGWTIEDYTRALMGFEDLSKPNFKVN